MQPQLKGKVAYAARVAAIIVFVLTSLITTRGTAGIAGVPSFAVGSFPPPGALTITFEGDSLVTVTWKPVTGAVRYRVYRSTISGSGYALIGSVTGSSYLDRNSGLINQNTYFYTVTAQDASGRESGRSNEVAAIPHAAIWMADRLSDLTKATAETSFVLGSDAPVAWTAEYRLESTDAMHDWPSSGVISQAGFGPSTLPPAQWTNWLQARPYRVKTVESRDVVLAAFHPDVLTPTTDLAFYHYAFRFSTDNGKSWKYAGSSEIPDPNQLDQTRLGKLTVTTPQGRPLPPKITTFRQAPPFESQDIFHSAYLQWDMLDNSMNNLLYYDVYRADSTGADPILVRRVSPVENNGTFTDCLGNLLPSGSTGFVADCFLAAGTTYSYTIHAVNRDGRYSPVSDQVIITTPDAPVQVTIILTPPSLTPSGDTIYITRQISTEGGLGPVDWTDIPMKCTPPAGALPGTCKAQVPIQEGTYFSFRFSRGRPETVQTAADGNSPAPDPSFWAYNKGESSLTVNCLVANWEDPLIIAHRPANDRVTPGSPVSFTWNQPIAVETHFNMEELVGDSAIPVPGSFSNNLAAHTITFYPVHSLVGGRKYRVTFSEITDTKGIHQVTPREWMFAATYPLFVPLISVYK